MGVKRMDELKKMLQLNVDEIEPEKVSRFEKKRVLQFVLQKKKNHSMKYIAASCLLAGGIGSTLVFYSPTIASHIPLANQIVEYFKGETSQFQYFEDYATGIGAIQESNGITIEIVDAIYDGTTVTLTFAIETEKDLGEHPSFDKPIKINGEIEGSSVTWTKKRSDTSYVGVITLTPELNGRSPSTVKLTWNPRSVWNHDTNENFEGDWAYEFHLKKIDVKGIKANYRDSKNGFTIFVPSLDITGYTINLHYKIQMPSNYALYNLPYVTGFDVKDEFGNTYEMITNLTGSTTKHAAKGSFTFANIQSGTKELIITPKLYNDNEEIIFDSFEVTISK